MRKERKAGTKLLTIAWILSLAVSPFSNSLLIDFFLSFPINVKKVPSKKKEIYIEPHVQEPNPKIITPK